MSWSVSGASEDEPAVLFMKGAGRRSSFETLQAGAAVWGPNRHGFGLSAAAWQQAFQTRQSVLETFLCRPAPRTESCAITGSKLRLSPPTLRGGWPASSTAYQAGACFLTPFGGAVAAPRTARHKWKVLNVRAACRTDVEYWAQVPRTGWPATLRGKNGMLPFFEGVSSCSLRSRAELGRRTLAGRLGATRGVKPWRRSGDYISGKKRVSLH